MLLDTIGHNLSQKYHNRVIQVKNESVAIMDFPFGFFDYSFDNITALSSNYAFSEALVSFKQNSNLYLTIHRTG